MVNRCPFCHEDAEAKMSVACQSCLARHHSSCWQEGGACSACGSREVLEPNSRGQAESLRVETLPSGTLMIVCMGFGVAVGAPLMAWLKMVHGIDRIGPVTTLVLLFGPFLLGVWLNAAINWKRYGPVRRRFVGIGGVVATLLTLLFLAIFSYALAFGVK